MINKRNEAIRKMRRSQRIAALLICFVLITMLEAGCGITQEKPEEQKPAPSNSELLNLLPDRTGFRWVYNGFAEYGHTMELKSVTPAEDETTYHMVGRVDDASGGEAGGDFSLSLDYVVKKGVLYQRKSSPKMMDNFLELELIRTPLKLEAKWDQKAKHRDGKEYQLTCSITDIQTEDGKKVYTVLYKDKNSDFYEKRRFKERIGVVSFETVWRSEQEDVVMGYDIYSQVSGYAEEAALAAFLPPLEKQLVYYGLAEYSHRGSLARLSDSEKEAVYQFNGSFQDGSGIPGDFIIRYIVNKVNGTVQEKVLENTRGSVLEINSKLHNPIILKLPLEVGNTWEQEVVFQGQKRNMRARIISIRYEGRTFYSQMKNGQRVVTVQYMVEGVQEYFQNTYVEERRFQEGWGMIGFSQIMKGDLGLKIQADDYEIEEAILNNSFGYGLNRLQD